MTVHPYIIRKSGLRSRVFLNALLVRGEAGSVGRGMETRRAQRTRRSWLCIGKEDEGKEDGGWFGGATGSGCRMVIGSRCHGLGLGDGRGGQVC